MGVTDNYKCENQLSIFDYLNKSKEFNVNNPIRLIELFSGYGSQYMSLKRLGADVIHHKISEWEINANKSYHAVHMPHKNKDYSKGMTKDELVKRLLAFGISNDGKTPMKEESIKRKSEEWCREIYNEFMNNDNLGSICNIKGKDLEITDTDKYTYMMTYSFPCFTANSLVLTSNGYKKIKEIKENDSVLTHNNQYKKVLASMCTGMKDIYEVKGVCTDKLECTENHRFLVTRLVDGKIAAPSWVEAKDLNINHFMMMPINKKEIIPKIKGFELSDSKFWFRLGEIVYQMSSKLKDINITYDNELMNTIINTFIDDKKHVYIPNYVLDLPIDLLKEFLNGFMDKKRNKMPGYEFTYIAKRQLIYMLGQCIAKAFRRPYNIRPSFMLNECKLELAKETSSKDILYTSDYMLYRVEYIEDIGIYEKVYDIEVEDDHSFVVNNCIAHNCQDLSNAGKGKGMKKGSGTRSGLLWEVERILKEIVEDKTSLPHILIMENVPQVINAKNKPDFDEWLHFLESIGYSNYYNILNAKDYGVAQSRKRCFMVSILGDYNYEFPKPIPLTKYLRDYLEENVDKRYYIHSENALKLIKDLVESGRLDNIPEENIVYDDYNSNIRNDQTTIGSITTNIGNEAIRNGTKLICKDTLDKGVVIDDTMGFEEDVRVYNDYAPSLRSGRTGLKTIVAMRGRNPDNPSDRTVGLPTEQRLEPNGQGLCNTLTSVTKDNLLLEQIPGTDNIEVLGNYNKSGHDASRVVSVNGVAPTVKENHGTITGIVANENIRLVGIKQATKKGYIECEIGGVADLSFPTSTKRRGRVIENGTISPTITTMSNDICRIESRYSIRKLTERECGRLMGVSDNDIDKMKSVCAGSQLYKQYGNSIVVDCLMALMSQLGLKGVTKWNNR